MTNLITELEFQKERNYTLYNELLMERQTGYDKVKLTTDYYNQINSLRLKQAQLQTFSKSLNTIGKGHQKLFENRNKITAKEIREVLGDYSAMLQDLIVDFKKL
jgi:t-SNARE complex subunit (syntaxin)